MGLLLRSTEGSDRSGRCPSCNILAMFGDECDRLRPPPALEIPSGSSFSFILEMLLFSSDRCKDDWTTPHSTSYNHQHINIVSSVNLSQIQNYPLTFKSRMSDHVYLEIMLHSINYIYSDIFLMNHNKKYIYWLGEYHHFIACGCGTEKQIFILCNMTLSASTIVHQYHRFQESVWQCWKNRAVDMLRHYGIPHILDEAIKENMQRMYQLRD